MKESKSERGSMGFSTRKGKQAESNQQLRRQRQWQRRRQPQAPPTLQTDSQESRATARALTFLSMSSDCLISKPKTLDPGENPRSTSGITRFSIIPFVIFFPFGIPPKLAANIFEHGCIFVAKANWLTKWAKNCKNCLD